jgi:uncharacterized phage protein (TIGR02216 family)
VTGHRPSIDWPALLRAGLHGLRLTPEEFWRLTPAELQLMLGLENRSGNFSRARLEELAAAYPDAKREPSDGK